MTIRTRFAPSPTGFLHIGGARTALFSWLYARQQGGSFILRIEDTDRERSTQASVQAILDSMQWLGLDWDEGPFYQTQRLDRYQQVLNELVDKGLAYPCYCSKERLETLRASQMANKEKPRYDGHCRNHDTSAAHSADTRPVIRFKNPLDGAVVFDDLVYGKISVNNQELDDLIIARPDGMPTYNFTVVVDDYDMQITHVIRGDDHINNTPRQINILRAMDASLPIYAHVPMILGADSKRLSKRHGAVGVMQYRDDGFLPDALLNYLVRLGWSHGDEEIFSRDDLLKLFTLDKVNRSASVFNAEKLRWLNQHYIKTTDSQQLAPILAEQLIQLGLDPKQGPDLSAVIEAHKERAQTLVDMAATCKYLFAEFDEYEPKAAKKNLKAEATAPLQELLKRFSGVSEWRGELLHGIVKQVSEDLQLGMGKVGQPLRVAVTGQSASPSIDITLELIGRERSLLRLQRALDYIGSLGA